MKHLAATRLSRLSVIDGTAAPEADRADTLRAPPHHPGRKSCKRA
ncbi:hypothetical protein ACH4E9_08285 [Streptomyces anulatus]